MTDYSELGQFAVDPACAQLLDEGFCASHGVVLLGKLVDRDPIHLGMLEPHNAALAGEVKKRILRDVIPVQLNAFEVKRAIATLFGHEAPEESEGMLILSSDRAISFEPDQGAPKLVDDLMSEAVARRASDVHIEVFHDDVDLRFRIDGVLQQVTTPLSVENVGRVIARLKVLANLNLVERRVPQDGRLIARYHDGAEHRKLQLRLAVIPGLYGEEAVIRILDPEAFRIGLADLGMAPDTLKTYESLIHHPYGLILVSGPTCSGKSTTLYSTLQQINTPANKVLTAEDPVEYEIAKVSQKEIAAHMTFADYARAFLRQNPDIIVIGEVRDEDTALQCVRAANTGHLVLSTIHTSDAITAVSRLRALKVEDDFLAEVLLGVMAQRLLRKLCTACKAVVKPDRRVVEKFYRALPDHAFYGPVGCDGCNGAGYRGRVGVFEMFAVTDPLRHLIASGRTSHDLRHVAGEHGYRPMAVEAMEKVREGVTSIDELARVVNPRFV